MYKPFKIDLHGLTVKQARVSFFCMLEKSLKEKINRVDFITGDGPVRTEVIKLLEDYNICWNHRPSNTGGIVAYFLMR